MTLTDLAMYHQTRFKQVIFLEQAIKQHALGKKWEQNMYWSLFNWVEAMHTADKCLETDGWFDVQAFSRGYQT